MKITNADIIKSGERELIDTIISDLDWDAIEKVVKDRHNLSIQDDVDYQQGDIVVYNNQVAYKLDFEVKMTLSVMFDRDGNYLSIATSADFEQENAGRTESPNEATEVPFGNLGDDTDQVLGSETSNAIEADLAPEIDPEMAPKQNFSKMASHIADMISDINENDE